MNDEEVLCEFRIKQNVSYMLNEPEEMIFEIPARVVFIPPKQYSQLGKTEITWAHCMTMSIIPTFRTVTLCVPDNKPDDAMDIAYKLNKFLESDEEQIVLNLSIQDLGFEQEITVTKK